MIETSSPRGHRTFGGVRLVAASTQALLRLLTAEIGTLLPCRPQSSTHPLMKEKETYD
jgi:hypothetical protein